MAYKKQPWEIQLEQDTQAISTRLNADPDIVRAMLYEGGDAYNIPIIKQYLRTPEQKAFLDANDWSIEDVLNGRIPGGAPSEIAAMFEDWNSKLGKKLFGS
jgi:hypothetical protein